MSFMHVGYIQEAAKPSLSRNKAEKQHLRRGSKSLPPRCFHHGSHCFPGIVSLSLSLSYIFHVKIHNGFIAFGVIHHY